MLSTGTTPWLALAILFALLTFTTFVTALVAHKRKRLFGVMTGISVTVVLLLCSVVFALLSIGLRGYRALTHEEVAAIVTTKPLGQQRFQASFEFPDGRKATFELAGDQLFVDAHILKWKSIANHLGLHTEYELDRVSGRYVELRDERMQERTVHSLAPKRSVDFFALRKRFPRLGRFVDTEYGSATFIAADKRATYEVRVSTSGLLIRPLADTRG